MISPGGGAMDWAVARAEISSMARVATPLTPTLSPRGGGGRFVDARSLKGSLSRREPSTEGKPPAGGNAGPQGRRYRDGVRGALRDPLTASPPSPPAASPAPRGS